MSIIPIIVFNSVIAIILIITIMLIISINYLIILIIPFPGWLAPVNSRILYELDHRKPILYVLPIENILGRLPVVPVGDTGTIPHGMRNAFEGAYADSSPGAGDGCPLWYVNSWALGWSREI